MGFEITGGSIGFLGAVAITIAISAGIIVLIFFVLAAKQSRDRVVEDTDHDIEA